MKETEQTLLEKIKDDLGRLHYGEPCVPRNENRFNELDPAIQLELWPIVCERYATAKAKASCEATLKKASDNAKIKADVDPIYEGGDILYFIDKDSITDPNNITIV